jgi:hypothetical protein
VVSFVLFVSDKPVLEGSVEGASDDMATGSCLCPARWSSRGHWGNFGEGYPTLYHDVMYMPL